MRPELNLFFVHTMSMGYGRFGSSLARELANLGITVWDDMEQPDSNRRAHEENVGAKQGLASVVMWASVPTHARGWWSGQHAVVSTMWESSRLPESFRETLHHFDQVIVPSRQNQELFSQYHDNVAFVPLGIDPDWWFPIERPKLRNDFRFLIAGSGPRKGTDLAYKAFRSAFQTWPADGPVPHLVMKNPRTEPFHGPRIEVIGGKISAEAERDLYATAHCYLQPSRGEGFGLQPLQAMAQGCPTILTAAHGHDAFAHLGMGLSTTMAKSAYFIFGDAGEWWEPSFDELVDHMRFVYDNYEASVKTAQVSAEVIAREFTWQRCAERTIEVIGRERLCTPLLDKGEWFTPARRRYLVITDQDWKCDIAGTSYYFRKGESYYEQAEVKRILFEVGCLDPECLKDYQRMDRNELPFEDHDVGLTEEQATRIPGYTAAHSFCPTCNQQLNTRPTRSDVLYAEADS